MKLADLDKFGLALVALIAAAWTYISFVDSARRDYEKSAIERTIDLCFRLSQTVGSFVVSKDFEKKKEWHNSLEAMLYGEVALLGDERLSESLTQIVEAEFDAMNSSDAIMKWYSKNVSADCAQLLNQTITSGWKIAIPEVTKTDLFKADRSKFSKKDQARILPEG